ncbi:aldo/keto reductase [Phototrophicus methaneseepsis]|uniref:Aldo/keto reductase n=2 Tax=Phototrophicus methaneseepsis TaxID=2710758 RepID=A0A7S8EE48_9CHLR|nr:aldo/keto reductase [Phototrophicus methaneseepsis]
MSTRTVFGAAALSTVTQAEADQTLDLLLEYGVNHIDTAASYGESELRIGLWMKRGYRDQFFLATKTGERTYAKAKEEFLRSLDRLQVDSVDLIQLHYLVGEEEWEVAMGPGGVLEYLMEARDQGLVKYIGVTGHDVAIVKMHRKSLDHYDFDSVLLPYNYLMMQNPVYAAGFNEVLRLAKERDVAVQTIKSVTRRPYQSDARSHATWYEPLTDQASIDKAVHWVLGQPGIFLNTLGDIYVLPKVLDAASRFESRPSDDVMQAMVAEWEMEPLFV